MQIYIFLCILAFFFTIFNTNNGKPHPLHRLTAAHPLTNREVDKYVCQHLLSRRLVLYLHVLLRNTARRMEKKNTAAFFASFGRATHKSLTYRRQALSTQRVCNSCGTKINTKRHKCGVLAVSLRHICTQKQKHQHGQNARFDSTKRQFAPPTATHMRHRHTKTHRGKAKAAAMKF